MEVDLAALDRVVGLLASVADDEEPGLRDATGCGSDRVQRAAEDVRGLLDAGANAVARELVAATDAVRSARERWRAQDAGLGGRA